MQFIKRRLKLIKKNYYYIFFQINLKKNIVVKLQTIQTAPAVNNSSCLFNQLLKKEIIEQDNKLKGFIQFI